MQEQQLSVLCILTYIIHALSSIQDNTLPLR